jgi:hypothetical protein
VEVSVPVFEITLHDRVETVQAADGYQLEGPLTTFFRSDHGRGRLDSWSTRIASYRSADVVMVRRMEELHNKERFLTAL